MTHHFPLPCAAVSRRSSAFLLRTVLLLALFAIFPTTASAAEITASADRDPVALNESFTLVFSAEDEPDEDPDFSPLAADFQVMRQGRSTRVEMVNGRLNRRTEWQVVALAKRAGTLNVPSIAFGSDRSRPFTLTVLPGKSAEPRAARDEFLAIEVEAEPRNPYVQAQVLYTIRLLHRVALRNGNLEDPKLIDAVVQKLGEDRRYQTERNGHLYGVVERRFAIFPQKSGPLKVEPIHLEAELSAGPGTMFDEFFGRRGQIRRIESEAITLQVRPIPSAFKGRNWLPAAKLELQENWSTIPPQTKVGEPITRTLSLKAEGVTMGMVPELTDASAAAPGLQRYPDQPALNEEQDAAGLVATRREKAAFIPMKDGDYTIPGVAIPWWNTVLDRMEVARVPERILKASPAPGLSAPEPAAPQPEVEPVAPEPTAPTLDAQLPMAVPGAATSPLWFWLSLVLGIGWLATVLAWWRHARRGQTIAASAAKPTDAKPSLREFQRAVAESDAVAARRALLDWAKARWRDHPPLNLEQLVQRLGAGASGPIEDLMRATYGHSDRSWNGAELLRVVQDSDSVGTASRSAGEQRGGLAALHRV
jgi:hypothetical protein